MTNDGIGPQHMTSPPDWEALARFMSGESSPEEIQALEARLAAQPADKELLDALATLANRMPESIPADLDVESALYLVKARRKDPVIRSFELTRNPAADRRRVRWRVLAPAIAAAALFVVGVAGYLAVRTDGTKKPQQAAAVAPTAQMVATGVGAIDSLRLPDGTSVVIGPLSSIRVVRGYGVERREVDVRGDVYLDVVHDSSKPFIAHANDVAVQDIGTKFAVHSDTVRGVVVSVAEGSVSLQGANTGRNPGVVLKPGERGVVLPDGRTSKERATPDDMAWMRRQLVFRETPLHEVAESLHRWYGIELSVPDASLAARHLTATFSGEPPERVLEMIRLVLGADIERRGDTAIIRARR